MEPILIPKVKPTGRYSYEAIPTDQKLVGADLYEKKDCGFVKLGRIFRSFHGVSHHFGFTSVTFGKDDCYCLWVKQPGQYFISKQ